MTTVTPEQIKTIREMTGAGMADCRKALVENNGDMDAAVDWLRKKGLASAAKKSGRVAAEGLVAVAVEGTKGAIIELNSETDFVSRNDKFQTLVREVAEIAVRHSVGDVEELKNTKDGHGKTVAENIQAAIGVIGENMNLRRSAILGVTKGCVTSYIHSATAPGMGKIGILVALESEGDVSKLDNLGKQLAMHIAASNPSYMRQSDVSAQALQVEKEAASEYVSKLLAQYKELEAGLAKYQDRLGQERSFSEKQIGAKLTELLQTLPNVDSLLADIEKFSTSEDRKDKQNADKTKKLVDIFFQEASFMQKKFRGYGDEAAAKQRLSQLRVDQFLEETVFEEQLFVIDGKTKISAVIEGAAKDVGAPVKVLAFVNFRLGEGVEKAQTDFAAEVAAAAGHAA